MADNVKWRKSSRSSANGGACVEVAAVWRRSSRSSNGGDTCVEVAGMGRKVAVRDSKNPVGPRLEFKERDWATFVTDVKRGRHDL